MSTIDALKDSDTRRCTLPSNGPFAAERSRGTKSPNWRANDALGHVKQGKFKFGGFVQYMPVRHLLSSLAILYYVIAQLQGVHSLFCRFTVPRSQLCTLSSTHNNLPRRKIFNRHDLGPVSQRSRNVSGLFREPQFPLCLWNAEV